MKPSKRRFTILIVGLTAVVALMLGGSFALRTVHEGDNYVRKILPVLTRDWDVALLRQNLTPDHFSDKDIANIHDVATRVLGSMKTCDIRRPTFSSTDIHGRTIPAMAYAINASFEKTRQGISFWVAPVNGQWQVVQFDVSSPTDDGNNLFKPIRRPPSWGRRPRFYRIQSGPPQIWDALPRR